MSGSQDNSETKPVSVAELLARNGTIGAPPVGGRRRRRRGNSSALSVSELAGEIPIITSDLSAPPAPDAPTWTGERDADEEPAGREAPDDGDEELRHDEPAVREAPDVREEPAGPAVPNPQPYPQRSSPPEPDDRLDGRGDIGFDVRAEEMAPDPVEEDLVVPAVSVAAEKTNSFARADTRNDVRTDTRADKAPSYGRTATSPRNVAVYTEDDEEVEEALEPEADGVRDEHTISEELDELELAGPRPTKTRQILRAGLVVVQSILAAALGAALFLAFDELWKWNNVVALVLSMLVMLGLVAAVRIIRKTEDTASTLIAVAVGALVTLGPLALMQTH